jgi:5-methyltetrahydropteroyltriglutamate--homocysteine methyltransferase
MRTSTDRILTTHVGSLPRTQAVTDGFAREKGDVADAVDAARINQAVHDVVRGSARSASTSS